MLYRGERKKRFRPMAKVASSVCGDLKARGKLQHVESNAERESRGIKPRLAEGENPFSHRARAGISSNDAAERGCPDRGGLEEGHE